LRTSIPFIGEVDVEDDDLRKLGAAIGLVSLRKQEVNGVRVILEDDDLVQQAAPLQGHERQIDVVLVVLDKE
jgi:hypothetical protein